MNWFKDNLILVLGALCLILALGWTFTSLSAKAKYSKLETKHAQAIADRDTAVKTNASNVDAIRRLVKASNELVAAHKANLAAAGAAGDRLDKLQAKLDVESAKSRALRTKLAQRDREVAAYMRVSMPRALYCQTWPEAPTC